MAKRQGYGLRLCSAFFKVVLCIMGPTMVEMYEGVPWTKSVHFLIENAIGDCYPWLSPRILLKIEIPGCP